MMGDYTEHLISMAGGDGDELDQIQRQIANRVGRRYAQLYQLIRDELQAKAWDEGAKAQAAAYGMAKDTGPNPYRAKP